MNEKEKTHLNNFKGLLIQEQKIGKQPGKTNDNSTLRTPTCLMES